MTDESKVSKDVADKVLQLVEMAKNTGQVRKGTNEATKAIERGEAKLVVIAGDVEPPEIVMHIPPLCNEKKIPYVYVPNKMELGRSAGIDVPSAAIAIADVGDGKVLMKEVLKRMKEKGE
jgi:large subunit ribosomal protein L7Ae